MIRTVIVVLFIVIFFIFSLPLFLVEWVVGKINPKARDRSLLAIVRFYCRFLLFLSGTKVTRIGQEKVPSDTCVLYVLNHRSYFDILLTLSAFPSPTGFIAKKELKKIPVLDLWITNLHGFFLDREDIRQGLKIILAAIDLIKTGTASVAIFPEGTRNKNPGDLPLLPFHEGSFKVALKTGCPIIPVSISGSADIFENHMPKIKKAEVIVEYGDPIFVDRLDREEKKHIGEKVQKIIEETLRKNMIG